MGNLIIGAVILFVYIRTVRALSRRHKDYRKQRFERTNPAGVLEFSTFDESEKFQRSEANTDLLYRISLFPGLIIPLIGLGFVVGGIGGMLGW
ncbi:hypothetical protein FY150_24835 (plasmid) [Agrobacterium tumefaciens]|nr:hypothetical protein FY150_24835 [Agrobacterium tumefaciens]